MQAEVGSRSNVLVRVSPEIDLDGPYMTALPGNSLTAPIFDIGANNWQLLPPQADLPEQLRPYQLGRVEAAAAPKHGLWRAGAVVWHRLPTGASLAGPAAPPLGYLCVEAGQPGVWHNFSTPLRVNALKSDDSESIDGYTPPAVAHASVRADKWLQQFPIQDQPSPITGRRVQIVVATTAAEDGLQSLTINGQQCLHLSSGDSADLTFFDWCRAHANNRTNQLWVSFHTRNLEWSQGPLQLIAGAGLSDIAVNETVVAVNLSLVISHVTSSDDGRQAIVHVHSECSRPASVTGLLFDGRYVDIHQQNVTIPPGGHAVFVTQVQWQMRRGDVWTAVLFVDGIETGAAYGGRTVGERFVTETWPKMNDCPLPSSTGTPNANATELAAMGIDSVYCGIGCFRSQCAHNAATAETEYIRILEHAASNNDSVHVFLDGGDKELNSHIPLLTRAKTVDAVLIGDEVDGALDAKHLRGTLNLSLESIRSIPDVPVYIGAATHAMVGAFAGIADIQGIDAYAAACAPTQLAVNKRLPLQYPYYYLRNARDNHAPNTMWGYSQLVHWNVK